MSTDHPVSSDLPPPPAQVAAAISTNLGLNRSSNQSVAYGGLAFAIGLVMNNAAATQFGMKKIEASALAIALSALGKAASSSSSSGGGGGGG